MGPFVLQVMKMLGGHNKVYEAFNPASKRLLIWQTQPALH